MSVLRKNLIANFGGSIWTGLMGLVFVPLYIRFLGIESYGLLGIYATIVAIFGLLDFGLSSTVIREMARLAVQPDKAQDMHDLMRTLEIPYWIIGILISVIIMVSSKFLAFNWVNVENLSPKTVQNTIVLMGILALFQWPISLYSGGLEGLQRQVLLNTINASIATVRGIGAVLVLWLISSSIESFFLWQVIVSFIQIGIIVICVWSSLPKISKPSKFRFSLFKDIWKFAAGITGVAILNTILAQLDKVILSRLLNLTMFGYYTLANSVASYLYRLTSPVYTATFPKLTNLVTLGIKEEIKKLYHQSAQLVSVFMFPAAIVLGLFSREIMTLWTQNVATAQNTYLLVSIITIGITLNGLANMPYALQLAFGWTRLGFIAKLVSVIILIPAMIAFSYYFGAIGAASAWVVQNFGYLVVSSFIMYQKLLPTEKWRWLFYDIGFPLLAGLVISLLGRLLIKPYWSPLQIVFGILVVSGASLLATAFVANQLNALSRLRSFLNRLVLKLARSSK